MNYKRPYKHASSVQSYKFGKVIFKVGQRLKYKIYGREWQSCELIAIVPNDFFELKVLPDCNKATKKEPWKSGKLSKIKAKNAIIIK